MKGFARGSEAVRRLVRAIGGFIPCRQLITGVDRLLVQGDEPLIAVSEMRLERGDRIVAAEQCLGCIVQEFPAGLGPRQAAPCCLLAEFQDGQAVLSDRQRMIQGGISGPAIGARKTDREVTIGPCEGVWSQQVEAASGG
jgi:hypothetical protein